MSHIVEIKTQVRDPMAVATACRRLGLNEPRIDCFRLFSTDAKGLGIELPGWSYPVVISTTDGALRYDNYNGAWGSRRNSTSSCKPTRSKKRLSKPASRGTASSSDSSIKLTIQVGGTV